MSSSSGWLTHVLGMADRCFGAWLTTMGLAAVAASWMHGGGPARPATIRPRPERNAASNRATRPSPPTQRPARSSPARRSTPPANIDTASRRTMSTMPHDRCKACLRRPVNYAQDITPEVCNLPPEMAAFFMAGNIPEKRRLYVVFHFRY